MEKNQLLEKLSFDASVTQYKTSGRVLVGLVDGSIDKQHPDLVDTDIRVLNGESCDSLNSEGCRHGTFMAGVIVANSNSSAPSLCPQASLISRPIFCHASELSQCPQVTEDHLIDAIEDCLNAGVNIINLSVGIHDQEHRISERLYKLFDRAEEKGVLLIASSGNQGAQQVSPLFRHPWIIPVAAMDEHGQKLPSANFGEQLLNHGVVAPGNNITSLTPQGETTKMSGTSVAAAVVTGVTAQLWYQYPEVKAATIRNAIIQADNKRRPVQLNFEKSKESLLLERHDIAFKASPELVRRESQAMSNNVSNQLIMQSTDENIVLQSCSCGGIGGSCDCPDTATLSRRNIYAVGTIKPVFPSLDVEKEFQAAARELGVSETDYYGVFGATNNPYGYIAEQMCWVMSINNINVYMLVPRSHLELTDIINALKPAPVATDEVLSVAIGYEQGLAPAQVCAGLSLPMVTCNQIYYFTLSELSKNINNEHDINAEAIADVIKSIEFKPNDGASAEDRAINYLAFRYPEIYRKSASMSNPASNPTGEAHFLAGIETKMSGISSDRQIVDVIFKYQSKTSGEQTFWYCGVDVSGQFPFLNTPLRTYLPVKQ